MLLVDYQSARHRGYGYTIHLARYSVGETISLAGAHIRPIYNIVAKKEWRNSHNIASIVPYPLSYLEENMLPSSTNLLLEIQRDNTSNLPPHKDICMQIGTHHLLLDVYL